MNILQQIWTYSTVFSNFLVNLIHAVALVPIIDHDVVTVGETSQFFAVASVNGGQIAVAVVVVAHQSLAVEGDGGEADMATVAVKLVLGDQLVFRRPQRR